MSVDSRIKKKPPVEWGKMVSDVSADATIKEIFAYDDDSLQLRTDLSPKHVRAITKLKWLFNKYGNEAFNLIAHEFMKTRVSTSRKGRTEFVNAYQSERRHTEAKMGILDRIRR